MEELEKIYNEHYGVGERALHQLAKQAGLKIKVKDVKEFMINRKVRQQYHSTRSAKGKGRIIAFAPHSNIQMDIVDMGTKYTTRNNGKRFFMCYIDVFTRKAYVDIIPNKTVESVYNSIKSLFENEFIPHSIVSDNDSSFISKRVQKLMEDNSVIHFPNAVGDHNVLGVIDRFIRTLKEKLTVAMKERNTTKWIELLDDVVKGYNNTPHSALKTGGGNISPNDVIKHKDEIEALNHEKANENDKVTSRRLRQFNVGDKFRILIRREKFKRVVEPNYSESVYEIQSINNNLAKLNRFKHTVPLKWLLKVPQDTTLKAVRSEEDILTEEAKQRRDLRKEGLDVTPEEIETTAERPQRARKERDLGAMIRI